MTTFAIATLGCKVNTYESQGYETALLDMGYTQVAFKEKADVYIINTCAVTNTASSKSRRKIHQAIALNPHALIAVVGCYAQTAPKQVTLMEHVDIVIGSEGKNQLAHMIQKGLEKPHKQKILHEARGARVFEALPIRRFEHQTRAFLKIQDGCNQFCSYCIIPFARGCERSLQEDEVMKTASDLVNNGHLEIVLSGIHTGRYGNGMDTSLLQLIKRMVKELPTLKRIRISSIEMNEISDELLQYMQIEPKIAKHLHIPVQAASDPVLKNMNRPYTITWFMNRVNYIRSLLPNISISSDVIAGFPQESEKDFQETYDNVKKMQLSFLHVFPYSKRDHSLAADMCGHLDAKVKKERASRLADLSKALYTAYKQSFIGKDLSVLIEKEMDGYVMGHSSEYLEVFVEADVRYLHKLVNVEVIDFQEGRLIARIKEEAHDLIENI